MEAVVNTPLLLLPSTTATIDDAAIGAVASIPPPPPSTMTAITAATQLTTMTARSQCQWSLFLVGGGNGGHRQGNWRSIETVAMVVFVNGSCHQWRLRWDGGVKMQCHQQQWLLRPMVVATMAVIVLNSPHQKEHYVPYYLNFVLNCLEIYDLGIISMFSTLRR